MLTGDTVVYTIKKKKKNKNYNMNNRAIMNADDRNMTNCKSKNTVMLTVPPLTK